MISAITRWLAAGAYAFTLSAGVLAAVFALLVSAQPAFAFERKSGDTIVIAANQTVDDNWAATGRLVQIEGTVHGDVYVLANTLRVTGVIDGDLIAAAQQVIIEDRAQIHGNVRAAGALVQMNGNVERNVTGAAQLLALGTGSRVGRSLIGAGDTVTIDGDVAQGADVALTSLTVGPKARIGGNLTYYADHEQDVPSQAVSGDVRYQHVDAQRQRTGTHQRFAPSQVFRTVWNFLSLAWLAGSAVVGLLLLRLFPRFVAEFLGVLEGRPLPSLGLGVLVLIATLPAAALVGLTIIGLPLSALLVAGYFSGIFAGWLLLAVAVGSILVGMVRGGRPWHHSWSFLLGLLVLFVVTRIPILGGLLGFAGAALGAGALVLTLHRVWRSRDGFPGPTTPLTAPLPAA